MVTDLAKLADSLYEASEDDDEKLAALLHEQPKEIADALCTSNLFNALQVYLYAFGEEPDAEVYEKLLLCSAADLPSGIKIRTVELADIVFIFDRSRSKYLIAVFDGDQYLIAYEGRGSLHAAVKYAKQNCAE